MSRGAKVWAALTDSERAEIALETAHLPRAFLLLQALDADTTALDQEGACPKCSSPRWVAVSLDQGHTRRRQCVPCGAIWPGVIKDETDTGSNPGGGA